MRRAARLIAVLALGLFASPLLAHGDEQHEVKEIESAASGSQHSDADRGAAAPITAGPAAGGGEAEHDTPQARSAGVVGVLKRLHPASVHFPIALFLMAALTELLVIARRTPEREAAVRIMLYGGAAGALVAVLFGWIHTGLWFGGKPDMQVHRWNGMLVAVLGLVAGRIASKRPVSRTVLRVFLFLIAALLIVQGYLGGELAHGPNHLNL